MSSFRRRRLSPPPQLPDDAIRDILLRTPPDDPRRLVRASLCCKPWRRLLSDPVFCRTYRELHRRTPPLLGFIHNKGSAERPHHCVLVPTTPFRPPGGTHRRNWIVLDSRHGRVLLYSFPPKPDIEFVVWDPITDEQWRVLLLPDFTYGSWSATVLCAMDGCDHLDCHGGPFLVVFAGLNKFAFASVYSSVAGDWSDTIFAEYPDAAMEHYPGMEYMRFMDSGLGFSALVGKTVYFPSNMSNRILEYNIAEKRLSVIDTRFPEYQRHIVLVTAEDDGMLVFAGVMGSSLDVWSREAGQDGAASWTRHKVIQLDMLVPRPGCWTTPDWDGMSGGLLVGSADGVLFLSTHVGSYTIEISSGKVRKLTNMRFTDKIIPYRSFYTIDHARGIRHHCHEYVDPST